MSPSDSRAEQRWRLCLPPSAWVESPLPAPSGLPGSSADLSSRAVSYHPGRSDGCSHPLLPHRCQASPLSGGLATFIFANEAETSSLALRLTSSPQQGFASTGLLPPALAGLLVERVIYKVNSFQFTRSARLVLALPEFPESSWVAQSPACKTLCGFSSERSFLMPADVPLASPGAFRTASSS